MANVSHLVRTALRGIAVPDGNRNATLSDLGITKKQSHEWQSIALVPRAAAGADGLGQIADGLVQ
jgi:hypothetical protein